ncbi:MAG: N-methyl-L-tryptophan oxidase [Pseudomonadota bacterium]
MQHHDLIILGTGAVGSAAMFHATQQGMSCLGLDRFPAGHDRGSSHGESRLIRLSYFEHPDYVPLLRRSYTLWDALDENLLSRSGVFYAGRTGGDIVRGVLESAEQHNIDVEVVDPKDFSHYRVPDNSTALFEPGAGWLPVERCVTTHIARALDAGAEHRVGETILGWQETSSGVEVTTDAGTYSAEALVIAGGAWNTDLLPDLALPLTVTRKHLHWFRCDDERYRSGFFMELEDGHFYGFPAAGGRLKLAEHTGGATVANPLEASREQDPQDSDRIDAFVRKHLPGVSGERLEHGSCFYTMTPDTHFIVDSYPGSERVAFAAGLSGHGFKMSSALGEALVNLATGADTGVDLDFLALKRFAL